MTRTKRFIQSLLRIYLNSIFDIEVKNNIVKDLEAPYLLVGNHQNNWDGFIMNIFVDEPIAFVVSDEQFRNPIVRGLLNYIHAIPTIKARVDISTIKRMIRTKKEEKILGLFPEGNHTWDGRTEPIYYSTAKLIKLLKIPVVNTSFKGGHLVSPRWAKYRRYGKIIISFDLLFSIEEIKKFSVDQIYQKLNAALQHDEFSFQEKTNLIYPGKRLAEKLENFLFTCPNCHSMDHMKSTGHQFFCKKCDYKVEYTERGTFHSKSLLFKNPRDWNEWQLTFLRSSIQEAKNEANSITQQQVKLKQGGRFKAVKKKGIGQIAIDGKNFYYQPSSGGDGNDVGQYEP